MNEALANLLREFIEEVRIRGRRTKCPLERGAATTLEQHFLKLLEKAETKRMPRGNRPGTNNTGKDGGTRHLLASPLQGEHYFDADNQQPERRTT